VKADVNADGSLGPKAGDIYLNKAEGDGSKADSTGMMSKEMFMEQCVKGTFH
jgi:hypothetical protein